MSLVIVARPVSEPERAAMVSLLEANDIPCFVHGANLAAMLPGLQIASYNNPTIMVPDQVREEALELLAVFAAPPDLPIPASQPVGLLPKLRMILEAVLGGWLVSQPPARDDQEDEA